MRLGNSDTNDLSSTADILHTPPFFC